MILGNGTLSDIKGLPKEAYQKMICALWSIPNLSNHFKEIINPVEGITWCSAGKDVQEYLKETYGIDSFLISAGVSDVDFYPTKKVTGIKNIGLNGLPFVNPEWDRIKRPQMLVDIANGINGTPVFINGKSLDNPHRLYDSIDMYVCTSTNDRGPCGISEAALCKIPVISTKTGYALEIQSIKTFDTVAEATEIINELNSSPKLLSNYIEEVYKEINSKLNWSTITEKYWIPIFKHHQKHKI
jgi:glycosyltransferase involved in cell wall biosynthesis